MNTEKYGNNLIECKICGYKKIYLNLKHFKIHNITTKEYLKRFNLNSKDLMNPIFLSCRSITLEHMIQKYGKEIGTLKFQKYCDKQAKKNTYKNKHQKYGWNKEDFHKYNQSRSVTLENMIKKYGEIDGQQKWKKYCDRQSYAGVKKEYFIEKYGIIDGYDKWLNINKQKSITLDNMISKYGIIKGTKKHKQWLNKILKNKKNTKIGYSYIANELFNELNKHTNNIVFYMDKNREYFLYNDTKKVCYFFDYYDLTNNKIIEFHGDYWHCNPKFYTKKYYHTQISKLAEEIWNTDKEKIKYTKKMLNCDILVIWENEYRNNKDKTIQTALQYLGYI
jgi:hypothetical protein